MAALGVVGVLLAAVVLICFAMVACAQMLRGCFRSQCTGLRRLLYAAGAVAGLAGVVVAAVGGFVWIGAILYHPGG